MKINSVFMSIYARDFAAQSEWWKIFLGRDWDREPMPSCHEWDMATCVLFQIIDDPRRNETNTVSLHVDDLDAELARLRSVGIVASEPVAIEGFDTLRYCSLADPEGNQIELLDGR